MWCWRGAPLRVATILFFSLLAGGCGGDDAPTEPPAPPTLRLLTDAVTFTARWGTETPPQDIAVQVMGEGSTAELSVEVVPYPGGSAEWLFAVPTGPPLNGSAAIRLAVESMRADPGRDSARVVVSSTAAPNARDTATVRFVVTAEGSGLSSPHAELFYIDPGEVLRDSVLVEREGAAPLGALSLDAPEEPWLRLGPMPDSLPGYLPIEIDATGLVPGTRSARYALRPASFGAESLDGQVRLHIRRRPDQERFWRPLCVAFDPGIEPSYFSFDSRYRFCYDFAARLWTGAGRTILEYTVWNVRGYEFADPSVEIPWVLDGMGDRGDPSSTLAPLRTVDSLRWEGKVGLGGERDHPDLPDFIFDHGSAVSFFLGSAGMIGCETTPALEERTQFFRFRFCPPEDQRGSVRIYLSFDPGVSVDLADFVVLTSGASLDRAWSCWSTIPACGATGPGLASAHPRSGRSREPNGG